MALAASNTIPTYGNINLVPLRVNVVSDDHNLTILETLVLDRTCLPIPLYDPLDDAIERNADELAYMLLSDMEVHGMGRTVRHFTGRVDLWNASLQQKIKKQLIPQLRHVLKSSKLRIVNRHLTPSVSGADEEQSKKRKRDETEEKASEKAAEKKEEEKTETTASLPKKKKKASPVPVRLRLCVNGIRIHDDFIWDKSVPQCPIEFARSLGKDLNLPDEAIVAIVTSIVEQLDGAMVDDTKDLDNSPGPDAQRKNATAAWPLEHRVHMANTTHLLTLHRPNVAQSHHQSTTSSSHH